MYQNPILFPQISNRESWLQFVELADDDTGDPITLTDSNGNPLYVLTLEISRAGPHGDAGGYGSWPWYDLGGYSPIITATLADYLSIPDVGIIQIMIPKSRMTTLCRGTYNVYMTIDPNNIDDGRQLFIGRLPVFYGGRNT